MWVWEYEANNEKSNLFMDVGEIVRFKVKEEVFTDTSPPGPTPVITDIYSPSTSEKPEGQRRIPYLIKVKILHSFKHQ